MGRGAPDRERDEADVGFLGKDFVAFFFTRNRNHGKVRSSRWMKGALNAPDLKAAASASKSAQPKGQGSKTGVRETVTGMKGWSPSACPSGSKPVRAPFKRANSCRTSDRSACLFPRVLGPRAHNPGDPRTRVLLLAQRGSAALEVGRKPRPRVSQRRHPRS